MDFKVRDGEIDVAILAGPGIKVWPTHGARVLSRWCADAGLKVGWYGGTGSSVRGVLPIEGSGGWVILEDAQKRLHRVSAKAVVKITRSLALPFPFEGWYSPGLIPESTAVKLMEQGSLNWHPNTLILGTGNRALKLGSEILQRGLCSYVTCLETNSDRVQGWEVEQRRFEMLGGKILFGKPQRLQQKSPFIWSFTWSVDSVPHSMDVARVISVGPFGDDLGFLEYPPGSFLVEWENTESIQPESDVELYTQDELRAVVLASRLIRGLGRQLPVDMKEVLDRALWIAKQKLSEMERRKEFQFKYEGKWLQAQSLETVRSFAGVPKDFKSDKILASIECIEPIVCRVCEKECPAHAIKIERNLTAVGFTTSKFLLEDSCTGCGRCVQVCPSNTAVMIEGDASQSFSTLVVSYREKQSLKKGERVSLINRRGESLATSRVLDLMIEDGVKLYKIEVPSHLIWEARGVIAMGAKPEVEHSDDFYQERGQRVDVQIQGEIRRVREGQMISVALFENGMSRPNDILICEDGSCGLCQIEVDGVKRYACQTEIHQGMSIRFTRDHEVTGQLCPCKEKTVPQVEDHCKNIPTETIEALLDSTDVTRGKCHGILCRNSFIKLASDNGVTADRFVDWTFPWVDWTVS